MAGSDYQIELWRDGIGVADKVFRGVPVMSYETFQMGLDNGLHVWRYTDPVVCCRDDGKPVIVYLLKGKGEG
jgi:hypothetical protein